MTNALSTANCIKNGYYTVDGVVYAENGAPAKKIQHIIKWYQVNMSYEDKYRLNLLTYPEYLAWMEELSREAVPSDNAQTFWHDDVSERENISNDAYDDFLSRNNIDIRSNTTLDMEQILKEASITASTAATPEQMVVPTDFAGNNDLIYQNESMAASENATPVNDGVLSEAGGTVSGDTSLDEVLANVNKDMHGGDAILSQEEIEALFAAAAAGNI